jgi:ubiquinone biosynthesis protein COQ9
MAEQKQRLAHAAMKQVPVHGWTQDAITAAVLEHPQMSISMSGFFTPLELVNWFMEDMNQQLRNDPDKATWSVYQKIQWRLEQVIPLVQSGHWHQGMALGLQTPETTRSQLHEFIELVAPPGSTIMYQTALGGIFVATELHLLADTSTNYEETWKFLQARLDELEKGQFVNLMGDGGSLPRAATTAVASSLLEGIASLILPTTLMGVPGTNPADYKPKQSSKK